MESRMRQKRNTPIIFCLHLNQRAFFVEGVFIIGDQSIFVIYYTDCKNGSKIVHNGSSEQTECILSKRTANLNATVLL